MKKLFPPLFFFLLAGAALAVEADVYLTNYLDPQDGNIKPLDGKTTSTARLFACPGQYEPASFAVQPHERLAEVMIKSSDLAGPAGVIPAKNVSVRSIENFHGGGRNILVDLEHTWDMAAQSKQPFWITVKVPEDAKPGLYKGLVNMTAGNEIAGKLALEVEVLPIKLETPPWSLGFNYSNPKNPQMLKQQLHDMREHGMTVVAPLYEFHMPVTDDDTSELGAFIDAYKEAGFKAPLYFAAPMNLTIGGLTGYGTLDSKRFQQKYLQVMRKLWAETQKHDLPVFFSIGDEFTNKGVAGVRYAGKLARFVNEELPELPVTSDMNGYEEVMAMAPYLNIATFNNGWDGIDHHNKGRRLINKDFLLKVQKETGAIPWFVNANSGRFPFGFFFWKMTKYGVKGKVEWYYNLGKNEKGSLVSVNGDKLCPTLDYETSRAGIDDLRYLCTLETLLAAATAKGKASAALRQAEELLKKLSDSIVDDWNTYTTGGGRWPADGFDVLAGAGSGLGQYNAMRRALADQILALQAALR